jgi:predicted acetyltransferase
MHKDDMTRTVNRLEVIAPEQSEALFQLFQLYYYENSDWAAEDIGNDGLFDACAASIADYVSNPSKKAYWIRQDGALAGFVVTEPTDIEGKDAEELADLFILKRYRRQGLALASVRQLAQQLSGPWLVAIYRADTRAAAFWSKAFSALSLHSVRQYHDPELDQFKLFAINE